MTGPAEVVLTVRSNYEISYDNRGQALLRKCDAACHAYGTSEPDQRGGYLHGRDYAGKSGRDSAFRRFPGEPGIFYPVPDLLRTDLRGCVLTAQYWGKQDTRTIEKVMGMSFRIAILSAAVFTALALCVPDLLMRIFTSDEAIIAEGVSYLRIVAFSYILAAFTNVYLNIIRSIERVVIATVVYATSLSVNIILNAVFIFGLLGAPAWGLQVRLSARCARELLRSLLSYIMPGRK